MEQRRKQYANEIRLNITRLENAQKRDSETLKNLGKVNISAEIYSQKQAEMKALIEKRQEELYNLAQRESDYISGRLDNEIKKDMEKNALAEKSRQEAFSKKKQDLRKEEEEKRAKLTDKRHKDDERNPAKDYAYFHKQFYWANESLPEYMRENLVDMPNNKGYIWRGCWFFGDRPSEPRQPIIMFEKKKGGIMCIHELDQYEHRIFEKIGKEKKRLISTKPKKVRLVPKIKRR